MFQSLGDIAAAPGVPRGRRGARTEQPVRRHSRAAGRETGFWRPTNRQDVRRVVLAARRYELAAKQPGSRNGPLGGVALEVLELLANVISYKTGRLDPSIDWMMERLKRSRDAIVRALAALRTHGFLDWLRRYVPTGNKGRGPQVVQTSNAYRLALPPRAQRLLGRYGVEAPAPDDDTHRRAQQAAEIERHVASLDLVQRVLFEGDADDPLTKALAKWADRLQQRESAKRTESQSKIISMS